MPVVVLLGRRRTAVTAEMVAATATAEAVISDTTHYAGDSGD